jgi:hypothetical protein
MEVVLVVVEDSRLCIPPPPPPTLSLAMVELEDMLVGLEVSSSALPKVYLVTQLSNFYLKPSKLGILIIQLNL